MMSIAVTGSSSSTARLLKSFLIPVAYHTRGHIRLLLTAEWHLI